MKLYTPIKEEKDLHIMKILYLFCFSKDKLNPRQQMINIANPLQIIVQCLLCKKGLRPRSLSVTQYSL